MNPPKASKKMQTITADIKLLLTPIKNVVHTITFDNGKEFV